MKNRKLLLAAAAALVAAGVFAGEHGAVQPYPNFGLPRVEEMMFLVLQIGVIIFAARLSSGVTNSGAVSKTHEAVSV